MAPKKPFKVIIAGGSIAGLGMANMLEKHGIDFVLLEAYPNIAPQVGASIGIVSHGGRILDQLNVFQKIRELAPPVETWNFRGSDGELLAKHSGLEHSFRQRHGYPILFLDRQMVLQALHEELADKSKVLTNKRVVNVEVDDNGVDVTTADGSSYRGDILIGADGVHSTVRSKIFDIANKMSPGTIPVSERTAAPCDYACIFGISNPCAGMVPGELHSVFGEGSSYLIIGGPGGRVYFFAFFKLPQKVFGNDIPRFTKADEAKIAAARANEKIIPTLTFGDIYKRKTSSALTALPEYVYKRWHFHRIITIGDSAHKVHPITGHGGNAAFESAATLVNGLDKALRASSTGSLSTREVEAVFASVQETRQARIQHLMEVSHERQRVEALETVWCKIQALYLLPMTDTESVMFHFSRDVPSSEKINRIKLPERPKLVPFKDELLVAPTPRGVYGVALIGFYFACTVLCYYGMWVRPAQYGIMDVFPQIVSSGIFPTDDFPLRKDYIGIGPIDDYLTLLTTIFIPGLKRWDANYFTLQLYFLGMLIQPIAIYTIESFRKRSAFTLLVIPSFWLLLSQSAGIGLFMPLYYIFYTLASDAESYWWPLSRQVPTNFAKFLLPATILGYVVPTVLMFTPWKDARTFQGFEGLWQPSPAFVPIFTTVFGTIYLWMNPQNRETKTFKADRTPPDLKHLLNVYTVTFGLGLMLHIYVVWTLLTAGDGSPTFGSVFWPDFSATQKTLEEGLRNLWLPDFYSFFLSSYVWCCSAVWDLKRVGRTSVEVGRACGVILLANILLGPGAAMSAVWYWRETAMAKTSFEK